MKHLLVAFFIVIALLVVGCDSKTTPNTSNTGKKEEHAHEHGPHGGEVLEVGEEIAHIELVHDEKAGKMTLYILGKDGKTAEAIEEAPMLNVKHKDTQKQIKTTAVNATQNKSSQFEATDEILKEEVEGRIAVTIKGTKYNVDLEHHH